MLIRQRIERAICKKLVRDLLAAGYAITVNDDESGEGDNVLENSKDANEILCVMFSTDGDVLYVLKEGELGYYGWISLIYGNDDGENVIHDYTINLEAIIKSLFEWIEQSGFIAGELS